MFDLSYGPGTSEPESEPDTETITFPDDSEEPPTTTDE